VASGGINELDASGVEMLQHLLDRLKRNGISLIFYDIKGNVMDVLKRTGLIDRIGRQNIFRSEKEALADIDKRLHDKMAATGPASVPT